MYKVKVYVTLRESVIDPQGDVSKQALLDMNYEEVEEVRVGKYIELTVRKTDDVKKRVEEMCAKLLVNTVIEDYRYDIEEVVNK